MFSRTCVYLPVPFLSECLETNRHSNTNYHFNICEQTSYVWRQNAWAAMGIAITAQRSRPHASTWQQNSMAGAKGLFRLVFKMSPSCIPERTNTFRWIKKRGWWHCKKERTERITRPLIDSSVSPHYLFIGLMLLGGRERDFKSQSQVSFTGVAIHTHALIMQSIPFSVPQVTQKPQGVFVGRHPHNSSCHVMQTRL